MTARCGTDTSLTSSARSPTPPSIQPDAGKRSSSSLKHAVGEGRIGKRLAEAGGVAEVGRVSEGYCGLDTPSGGDDLESQARRGLCLRVGGGHVLGLDDHRGASGRGDQDIGLKSGVVDDDLGVLRAHDASGEHLPKKLAEGVVGAGFSLLRHFQDGICVRLFVSRGNYPRRAGRVTKEVGATLVVALDLHNRIPQSKLRKQREVPVPRQERVDAM